ncbi:MAG: hypothetical protein JO101_03690 [Candidatus Eremiobacteraeota bacterium]|nr:hypothetical protein [Candidatus Eremiobacteraeota bacterium]MBV8354396.1 hypothetical protein [Candidatus Eremiobacteraeota bacterium]
MRVPYCLIATASAAAFALGAPAPAAADEAGYLYTYAVDSSRYQDVFAQFDAYKPLGASTPVRPLLDLFVSRDEKTGTRANVPLILSDNYVLAAAGLQYTNGKGLRAFVEGGASEKFGPIAALSSGGDVRGGIQFYRDWGTGPTYRHAWGSIYASTVYYSRYSDWILYSQGEAVAALASPRHPFEPFLRAVVNLDTQRHYYSNLAEAGAGIRYHPFGRKGPGLEAMFVQGVYLRNTVRPAGQGTTYTDFRPAINYGTNL